MMSDNCVGRAQGTTLSVSLLINSTGISGDKSPETGP